MINSCLFVDGSQIKIYSPNYYMSCRIAYELWTCPLVCPTEVCPFLALMVEVITSLPNLLRSQVPGEGTTIYLSI